MFVACVYGKLPKGNVTVRVADGPAGPVVQEVKGLSGGSEWVANEIEGALAYHSDGTIGVRWEEADIPPSLRKRIVVKQ